MRESVPFAQYATPRVDPPRGGALPASCGGTSNQTTFPVAASSATTLPTPELMYRRLSTMIGVFCQLVGAVAPGQIALSSSGTPDCRQAIDSLATVSLLIWSSG